MLRGLILGRRRRPAWAPKVVAILAAVVLLGTQGCSEDPPAPTRSQEPPQVRVLYPPNVLDQPFVVADSIYVYVGAYDADGLDRLGVYYTRPIDAAPVLVAEAGDPIDRNGVPAEVAPYIQIPADWALYRVRWRTNTIQSGSFPQLFARATDSRGAVGVSQPNRVIVLNIGDDLHAPVPLFSVTPDRGTIDDVFSFDPKATVDQVETDEQIQVRWDFDGDTTAVGSGWSLDWDEGLTAADIVTWTYAQPRVYVIRLQARNSYINGDSLAAGTLEVLERGGDPAPPQPDNYTTLPNNHEFYLGVVDSVALELGAVDQDEVPANRVRFLQPRRVEKTEVTNALYMAYLVEAIAEGDVVFRANLLFGAATPQVLYLDLANARIFYDIDAETFRIQPGYEQHPVTGVTWYGAQAYCLHYHVRLPYEAEWEVAARGDSVLWQYPFGRTRFEGDVSGVRRMNFANSQDPFGTTTPVRFYDGQTYQGFETIDSPSAFGCYDMSGNVAEWVADWYAPYPARTDVLDNPQGPLTGAFKVIRGGNWQDSPRRVRVTDRSGESRPDVSYPSVGFRTAYSVVR